jgi:hypothetical protein
MSEVSKLEFDDLAPREVPVRLGKQEYILAEASAGAAAAYDNRKMKGATLGEDGTFARLENLADLRPYAISLCLRKENGEMVTEEWVRSLPDRIIDPLYDRLREISPSLFGTTTVEDLERQRSRIDEAIKALEAKKGDPKGSPAGTSPNSSTAGN